VGIIPQQTDLRCITVYIILRLHKEFPRIVGLITLKAFPILAYLYSLPPLSLVSTGPKSLIQTEFIISNPLMKRMATQLSV